MMADTNASRIPRTLRHAFCHGYERLAAWSDLLDRINVFPVADADTGTNLKISLAPLRRPETPAAVLKSQLMRAATGNSGNIAAAFFNELVEARTLAELHAQIPAARKSARTAVMDPQPGTMLTVFDELADFFSRPDSDPEAPVYTDLVHCLEATVVATPEMLPVLGQAGVVDAGALGMFIFLEACFAFLLAPDHPFRPVTDIFASGLWVSGTVFEKSAYTPDAAAYCVSLMLTPDADADTDLKSLKQKLGAWAESVVASCLDHQVKIHLHTTDPDRLHRRISGLGTVSQWSASPVVAGLEKPVFSSQIQSTPEPAGPSFSPAPAFPSAPVHIMTDAAGSMTREAAKALGVTLLDSYLIINDQVYPETLVDSETLYAAMREGVRVTTAQASVFERHQSYQHVTSRFDEVLYLCVGSMYTGNFNIARQWQETTDPNHRLHIMDTGTASGRLGIAALATARFAGTAKTFEQMAAFARRALDQSRECVFLDTLRYLAAGGRISKTRGFFGDLLHLKPVISPLPEGAAKVGLVRSQKDQLAFALNQLDALPENKGQVMILLQYTDNRDWVESVVLPAVSARCPAAEIQVQPLSLTSGAHMGPGTWAMADLWMGDPE